MDYPGRVIKKNETNVEIVKTIQSQINFRGFDHLEVNGIFDLNTETAVKLFQSQSRDSFGNPLVVDGQLGPISWAVLFASAAVPPGPDPKINDLIKKVFEIAESQVGVMEAPPGSNSGPQVDKFLATVGCHPGDPWCASFVYWCFNEAANSLKIKNPLVKTGSCMNHWNTTKAKKIPRSNATNNPLLIHPGFLFIMDHGGGKGHTGIVKSVDNGFIDTIEGNTSINGSREGLAVAELRRKINTISAGFIDYTS